ncbi:neutral zinc metallopeptidase [Actinosynnema pretiosum subsp. pretiosum]
MTQPPPPNGWPPPRAVAPPPAQAPLPPTGGWGGARGVPQGGHWQQQPPPPQQPQQQPWPGYQGPPPPSAPPIPPPAAWHPPSGPPRSGQPPLGNPWQAQPQQWPQYHPYPAPRRKSNAGVVAFAVISGVLVLGVGLVGMVASALGGSGSSTYSGQSTYSYTPLPSYTYTQRSPAPTTTTSRAAAPPSTPRPQSTGAQNAPKAVFKLGDHPLHRPDVGAFDIQGCSLPGMDYSPAGQERFLRAALPCVEAAWKPTFQRTNLPYQPVELAVVTSRMTNSCGTVEPNATARYCNGTIFWTPAYYSAEQGQANANHPGKYLGQLAHEYGHHVQWLAGILKAAGQAQYDRGGWDTPAGLDLNRRLELQATCFGGMTLAPFSHGAIPTDVIQHALTDASNRGDNPNLNRDHGSTQSNSNWVNHGFKNNSTSACNTWAADANAVS